MKDELVTQSAENKKTLSQIEDQILDVLAKSKDILADSNGIEILSKASVTSVEINKKQEKAKEVEKEIDEKREFYKDKHSNLEFSMSTIMGNIDCGIMTEAKYMSNIKKYLQE